MLKNAWTIYLRVLFCLAEAQNSGRGDAVKKWVSPFGSSIYMSMAWTFSGGYQSIAGLITFSRIAN